MHVLQQPARADFLSALEAALPTQQPIFLAPPKPHTNTQHAENLSAWTPTQQNEFEALLQHINAQPNFEALYAGCICIPTGGTSGHLKFAVHTWESLSAAAALSGTFLNTPVQHTASLLPLWHVSGLMPWVRAKTSGGTFQLLPKNILNVATNNHSNNFNNLKTFIKEPGRTQLSLTPTHLARILEAASKNTETLLSWLQSFGTLWLGGAPASLNLLQQARAAKLPIAPVYGMSETAAMVAAQHPACFLQAPSNTPPNLKIFEGVHITDAKQSSNNNDNKTNENTAHDAGELKHAAQPQPLSIQTPGLFKGYIAAGMQRFPGPENVTAFITEDTAALNQAARTLTNVRRLGSSFKCGGELVHPKLTQTALKKAFITLIQTENKTEHKNEPITDNVSVYVLPLSHAQWGHIPAAFITVPLQSAQLQTLKAALKKQLPPWQIPKRWLCGESAPKTPAGKLNTAAIKTLLEQRGIDV